VNPVAGTVAVSGPTSAVQLVVILGLASLAPAIVLTCTCFARFIIAFSFLKNGLGTQGAPPSQILAGLALFMTLFVMAPVASQVHDRALAPYLAGKVDEKGALEAATPPLRSFFLAHTRQSDLALFYDVSRTAYPKTPDEVPLKIAIPAFVLSELRTAFEIGLVILLPFLVIDLVVATVLSSLGMVMLPPTVVALPVKLIVFLAADGWHLVVSSLLKGMA
jgi:flagellar biosynthesis protein FliP